MASTLQIRLLGEFNLTWHTSETEAPVATLNTPRLQSLLAYLVLHRDAPQSRRHLAFCLWPDLREERARANLRKLFYQLQRALPEPDHLLSADAQTLQWRPDAPFSLDVAEFERAANDPSSVADLQRATDLYTGDLLPSCYDDWIMPERERLRQMLLHVLERLIQLAEDDHNYRAAIGHAQRLLQLDPLREETHRRLISLHTCNDDRAAALRAYHACASILQRELGIEPSPATRQVYERLLNLESTAPVLAATFPLVGRDQEWAQLRAAWRAASAGHPYLALVTGEAGIGKTRLAEELLTWANRQGIRAAVAPCYAAEGALAYAPVVAWLRARPLPKLEGIWLAEVTRLLPELLTQYPDLPAPSPLTEAWQRQRLHEALARAVLGGGSPLLLVIEDLQWCDRDTLEWLRYLLRFDSKARLLILGTLRLEEALHDHPAAALLSALRHNRQLTEIALRPLDAEAAAQLARHVSGNKLDSEVAARLYRETEGNPLFIVAAMRVSGSRLLSPTIQAVMSARLAQLSPQAHELVELAATVGREFTLDLLRQASGSDEEALVHGLDELWQRRIVRETGMAAYDFSHGKLREAAYAGLSAARKRLLHRRVAEALQAVYAGDLDSVSAQMATHYEQAGLPQQAIAHYHRAAEAARRMYANDRTIAFLTRALDLTPTSDLAQRCDLLLEREPIYDVQGMRELQLRDITDLQALAQALQDGQRQAEASLRWARYAEAVSDYVAAIEAAQAAIRLSQATRDARREAAGYLRWGQALWQHGDYDSARERLEQALELAQAAHAPDVEADSLHSLSAVAEYQGNHIGARDRLGQALRRYREMGDRRGEFRALNNLGVASICLGDRADAQSSFEQALRLCREIGARQGESIVLRNLGGLADYRGDYATAQTCYEQSLQLCRATGERRGESETLTYLGLLFHHLGNHQTACEHSRRAAHIAQQVGAKYEQGLALTHLGHALLSLGQLNQAADAYGQALTIRRALGDLDLVMEPLAGLAFVSLAQDNLAQAQAHIEEILSYVAHSSLDGADEPFRVYWACYRVLQATRDPRAMNVLKTAYNLLQAQAAKMPDTDARRAFLANVAVHREIIRAWRAIE